MVQPKVGETTPADIGVDRRRAARRHEGDQPPTGLARNLEAVASGSHGEGVGDLAKLSRREIGAAIVRVRFALEGARPPRAFERVVPLRRNAFDRVLQLAVGQQCSHDEEAADRDRYHAAREQQQESLLHGSACDGGMGKLSGSRSNSLVPRTRYVAFRLAVTPACESSKRLQAIGRPSGRSAIRCSTWASRTPQRSRTRLPSLGLQAPVAPGAAVKHVPTRPAEKSVIPVLAVDRVFPCKTNHEVVARAGGDLIAARASVDPVAETRSDQCFDAHETVVPPRGHATVREAGRDAPGREVEDRPVTPGAAVQLVIARIRAKVIRSRPALDTVATVMAVKLIRSWPSAQAIVPRP